MVNQILSERFWLMEANFLKQFLENVQSKSYSDVIEIEARATEFERSTTGLKPYKVQDGIAEITIHGPLLKRVPSILAFLFGIQSMESIGAAFNSALSDKDVTGIFLNIDSPGSEVDGVQTLSNIIFDGRGKKPILSFINGSGTSGAYWIASASNFIALADSTSRVGSIGIIGTHMEYSEQAKEKGIGIHVFSSGSYKKAGNMFEALSKKDIEYIDGQFKYYHDLFIDGISKNLGISKNKIPSDVKEARVFIGQQGIDAGLADAIMTKDQAITKLKSMTRSRSNTSFSKTNTNARSETVMKYKDYSLIDIIREIQAVKDLDELQALEEDLISECKRRKAECKNWHEEAEAESLEKDITSLASQQRRMILAKPEIEKRKEEYAAGQAVARAIIPDRCKI